MGDGMRRLILVFVFFLSLCSLSASEQTIVIKTSGGAERPSLKKGGESYVGYNDIKLHQDKKGNITLVCTNEGWEQCDIDSNTTSVICNYKSLYILANSSIKNGLNKGTITDKIDENKKSFKRTVSWNSTGYLKTSEITITLEDE
jgi:hypothetical protein